MTRCVVTIDKIECICESNDDQVTGSDEVYFAFAAADNSSKRYVETPVQEDVDTDESFSYSTFRFDWENKKFWVEPFVLWDGDFDGPLQFHFQAWEEDNGKSPVRQDAAKILGRISEFMLQKNKKGGRPGTRKGQVEGMWNFVAGVTGVTALILGWMEDDFIGESTILFDKLPTEEAPNSVQSVDLGDWY